MRLEDVARRRIVAWLAAHPTITQAALAAGIGVSQTWVSQYKSGTQGANIDQLDAMARVFGHTLTELFDLRPDPQEQRLLTAFRSLPEHKRPLAAQALEAMLPDPPQTKRSRGTR